MNKIQIILIAILSVLLNSVQAQDKSQNYVQTVTMLTADGSRSIQSVQYYNGLGYPTVSVGNVGGGGQTAYSLVTYDGLGREECKYLPVSTDKSVAYKTPTSIINNSKSSSGYSDNAAYSKTQYDALDRPVSVTTAGSAFASKPTKMTYSANAANEVILYSVGSDGKLKQNSYYPANSLTKETTTDPDGKKTETFKDFNGKVVLQRVNGNLCTYYVYNYLQQLCFVLPPKYQTEKDIAKTGYEYRYDERGRIRAKILPGCSSDSIKYWYDNADRMICMQDPAMRSAKKYRFFVYDKFSHLVVQGMCTACYQSKTVLNATFSTSATGVLGTGYVMSSTFTNSLKNAELEIANYYDGNQKKLISSAAAYNYLAGIQMSTNNDEQKGMLTATVSASAYGQFVAQTMFYDIKGNLLQTQSKEINGRLVSNKFTYSFTNKPLTSNISANLYGNSFTVNQTYGYNAYNDQKSSYSLTVNHGTANSSSFSYTYDKLGRMSQTTRNGLPSSVTRTVSYTYDMHGWLTNIATNSFTEELFYADGPGTRYYNGNISCIKWKDSSSTAKRGYRYTYDGANRMTQGKYGEGESVTDNINRYTERLTYDDNGNITSIIRCGKRASGYGHIDNLSIEYVGNQLSNVTDSVSDYDFAGSFEYKKAKGSQYIYNKNGSLIADKSRGIAYITYDFNNNPKQIYFTNGNVTKYIYSAAGQKLRVVHYTAKPNIITRQFGTKPTAELTLAQILQSDSTDYLIGGSLVLKNGKIDKFLFDGGYAKATATGTYTDSFAFHYYNKDHLGNNREVVNAKGNVVQVTNYYPFGAPYADASAVKGANLQQYKYNGKELDTMHGLNSYDYGARQDDPILGRWDRIDPLCEKYYPISPYAYCLNNPLINKDPDGRVVETAWDVANVVMDVASCAKNIATGNYVSAAVDAGALIVDAAATILPGVPGGAGAALKVVRGGEKVVKATKNTYRRALQQATGKIGKGFEAHHTIPQKYRNYFEKIGINIDKPGNVVWRESKGHHKQSNGLTAEWSDFMSKHKGKPTKEQIYKFRDQMEKKYFGNKSDVPKN